MIFSNLNGFRERRQGICGCLGECMHRCMKQQTATHLVNLLVDPIPANQCLDVAPNQEGGENHEDEEPGEQETQAHAAERRRGDAEGSFADLSGLAVTCLAPRLPPVPGHASWVRELLAPREEQLLPNPPAQAVYLQKPFSSAGSRFLPLLLPL